MAGATLGYAFAFGRATMVLEIYQVDAFTDRPFAGNPAAVCPLPAASFPEAGWMQALAAEMNLSETAFLVRRGGRSDNGN